MRVLVDAFGLSDDSSFRGIGTYLRHLLPALANIPGLDVQALSLDSAPVPEAVARASIRRRAPGRYRNAEHELLLPWDIGRQNADVFHSPALDPPWRGRMPWVQTLHDVIPLVFDDPELRVERRRWQRHRSRYSKASALVAVSNYTAHVAAAALDIPLGRIEVIHHGVSPEFRPADAAHRDEPPYVLLVGEYSRRKGYPEAFAALGELAQKGHPHRLHVTGRIAPWVQPKVDALVAAAPRPDRIELRGFVRDLVSEYQNADLLLMTSRYEGFGLPIIEAMACGTPVVAFANSSITEVVGDAGVLVRDGDVPAMAAAASSVLRDPALHADLSERGLMRARSFTWQRCAEAYGDVYRRSA